MEDFILKQLISGDRDHYSWPYVANNPTTYLAEKVSIAEGMMTTIRHMLADGDVDTAYRVVAELAMYLTCIQPKEVAKQIEEHNWDGY